MNPCYLDILLRITDSPKWFTQHGVPRYEDFHPRRSSDIYADEVVLLLISCQACGRQFEVEKHSNRYLPKSLEDSVPYIHYGDPPNIGCCNVGPTMSSESIRILQFWKKENYTWVRKPELEVELRDD